MTENWTYRLRNILTRFDVVEVVEESGKARRLTITTPSGPVTAWFSRRHCPFYRFAASDRVVMEVLVPDRLCEKMGIGV